ncbi:MAG: hypothetical protein H0X51_07945 [Parachlamydiaceae bacterium]|nr:hypothetical protein [Parachlamydiaceae bacterium]
MVEEPKTRAAEQQSSVPGATPEAEKKRRVAYTQTPAPKAEAAASPKAAATPAQKAAVKAPVAAQQTEAAAAKPARDAMINRILDVQEKKDRMEPLAFQKVKNALLADLKKLDFKRVLKDLEVGPLLREIFSPTELGTVPESSQKGQMSQLMEQLQQKAEEIIAAGARQQELAVQQRKLTGQPNPGPTKEMIDQEKKIDQLEQEYDAIKAQLSKMSKTSAILELSNQFSRESVEIAKAEKNIRNLDARFIELNTKPKLTDPESTELASLPTVVENARVALYQLQEQRKITYLTMKKQNRS